MQRPFYVQLHMHTSESSRCGAATGAEMARAAWKLGYSLVVITDHFFTGNCVVKPWDEMPWAQKVAALTAGYRAAKAEGDRLGLKVLLGWEYCDKGVEYNTFGLGEDFLLANPDICQITRHEYLARVMTAGGWSYQVHPYRKADYIPANTPDPAYTDSVETHNAANQPEWNRYAAAYAKLHGLARLAGSDAHVCEKLGFGAMQLPHPVETAEELIAVLRSGQAKIVEEVPFDAHRD